MRLLNEYTCDLAKCRGNLEKYFAGSPKRRVRARGLQSCRPGPLTRRQDQRRFVAALLLFLNLVLKQDRHPSYC
jgi:hypothetical protein